MGKNNQIPLYTRVGIRLTLILTIVLVLLIMKNCVGSIIHGTSTGNVEIEQSYDLGFAEGVRQAEGLPSSKEFQRDNLLLKKMHAKGFRDGWDSVQGERGKKEKDLSAGARELSGRN